MTVLIRCDARAELGVGHLGRALAVAAEAAGRGRRVVLSGTYDAPWAVRRLRRAPFDVVAPVDDPDGLAALAHGIGAGVLHVDHYGDLGGASGLLGACRARGVVLSNVADFGFGAREADVTVNPNFGAPERLGTRGLSGPGAALVRPEVRAARAAREQQAPSGRSTLRVAVVMGGTDAFGVTAAAVGAVLDAAAGTDTLVDVLAPDPDDVRSRVDALGGGARVRVNAPVDDLSTWVADADLAVSAAGTSVLELCCIGVPTAVIAVADNQSVGYAAAVAAGVVVGLGERAASPRSWTERLAPLLRDPALRSSLAARARATVDGDGAARLLDLLDATDPDGRGQEGTA